MMVHYYNCRVSGQYPSSCFYLKQCFGDNSVPTCFQVKPTQMGPASVSSLVIGTSFIDWAQLSRFYLKGQSSFVLKKGSVLNKNGMMDNVQKHNSCNRLFIFSVKPELLKSQ
jgi:hypothetical protein